MRSAAAWMSSAESSPFLTNWVMACTARGTRSGL